MYSISPQQAHSFSLLISQQPYSTLLLKMPFQTLLWQKLAFSSPFFYFNHLSSISLSQRHCVAALLKPSSCPCHAYPFNRSVVPLCSSSFILSSLSSLFNRSVVRICNSLILFPTGVLSTSLFLVAFFLSIWSTSQGSWFHSFAKEAT